MQELEEVKQTLKQNGLDIDVLETDGILLDEKIKPLVIVLNSKGFKTIASCQGHSLEDHKKKLKKGEKVSKETPYSFLVDKKYGELKIKVMFDQAPWIDMQISSHQKATLTKVLEEYNKKSSVKWNLQDNLGMTEPVCRLTCHHEHDIDSLHEQISLMTNFVNSHL